MEAIRNNGAALRLWIISALAVLCAACQTVPNTTSFSAGQVAVLEDAGFVAQPDGSYLLGISDRLLFDFDQSVLRADTADVLGSLADKLSSIGIKGARVVGHADSVGDSVYNQQLSERRALAVKSALSQYGMIESRLRAIGAGESDPIENNRTEEGRSQNRRVEVIVGPEDLLTE